MKLIKFYADWCLPCKMMTRLLEEDNIGIEVEEVDIENIEDSDTDLLYLASTVRAVPTMFLVEGNVIYKKWSGVVPTTKIKEAIKQVKEESNEIN